MTYAASPVADELYTDEVRPALIALTEALNGIDDAIDRLAVLARLEEKVKPILDLCKYAAVREARDAGESLATIGATLGVSPQRAHQLANPTEETSTP